METVFILYGFVQTAWASVMGYTMHLDISTIVLIGAITFLIAFRRGATKRREAEDRAAFIPESTRIQMESEREEQQRLIEEKAKAMVTAWFDEWMDARSEKNDDHTKKLIRKAFERDRIGRERVFNAMMEMKRELGVEEPLHELTRN